MLLGAFERFGLAEPGGAELVQVGKAAGVTLRAKVQRQGALAEDDEPGWPPSGCARPTRGSGTR